MNDNTVSSNKGQEAEQQETVKVVLADDDKDDQEIFEDALNEASIPAELKTVDNGQELLDHLKDPSEPNPDIIFLDINMPVKSGKEVLAEIKADETLKDIPTVVISTSDHPRDIEDTFKAGANLFVRKPFSFSSLIIMLKKIFMLKWAGELFKPLRKTFFMSEKNISERGDIETHPWLCRQA